MTAQPDIADIADIDKKSLTPSIDSSGVQKREVRDCVYDLASSLGYLPQAPVNFWESFASRQDEAQPNTVVVADLSNIVKKYRAVDALFWTKSVRLLHPYFVALVRTRADEKCVSFVDELMRHSDLRMSICRSSDSKILSTCLHGAINALQPNTVLEVRYLKESDVFFVIFGDGESGTFSWTDLGIEKFRDSLLPESVLVGENGSSVRLLTIKDDIFNIDADSIRASFDPKHAQRLESVAKQSDEKVGSRIRHVRRSLGLSQKDLGERVGLDQAIISRLERGVHRPRVDTLRRIAKGLDRSISELLPD